jgi:hypothetical protein
MGPTCVIGTRGPIPGIQKVRHRPRVETKMSTRLIGLLPHHRRANLVAEEAR